MMRGRWFLIVAVVSLASAGCTTFFEVSAPSGANHAGWSIPQLEHGGPVLSGDGRYSVFVGPRTATSSISEVFRRDLATGTTVRVTSDAGGNAFGGSAPAISRDGRFVVFQTTATLVPSDTNLDPGRGLTGADWYVKDMSMKSFELVSLDDTGHQLQPGSTGALAGVVFVSASGQYVAFQFQNAHQDRQFTSEIYVRDRQAGVTHLVGGGFAVPAGLSGDGLHVGIDDLDPCESLCQPPSPGAHIADWQAGTTYTIGCEAGGQTPMTDDGRYVAVSQVNQARGCDTGVARYDRFRAGVPDMFTSGSPDSPALTMSADATRVAFATNDANAHRQVYVSDTRSTLLVSRDAIGTSGNGDSRFPDLSADGTMIAFDTSATNLVPADTDGHSDTIVTPAVRPADLRNIGAGSSTVLIGGSTGFEIAGPGIAPNALVVVSGDGITVTKTQVFDNDVILLQVTAAPSATPGQRTITVVNPAPFGIASASCVGCLTVSAGS